MIIILIVDEDIEFEEDLVICPKARQLLNGDAGIWVQFLIAEPGHTSTALQQRG